ncbi:MAG: hypothetical protein V7754_15550 [Halioglobus sp.]
MTEIGVLGLAALFIELPKNSRVDILFDLVRKGECHGIETPDIPDKVDEADAGDVMDGIGVGGLLRVRRVCRDATKSLIL